MDWNIIFWCLMELMLIWLSSSWCCRRRSSSPTTPILPSSTQVLWESSLPRPLRPPWPPYSTPQLRPPLPWPTRPLPSPPSLPQKRRLQRQRQWPKMTGVRPHPQRSPNRPLLCPNLRPQRTPPADLQPPSPPHHPRFPRTARSQ